MSENGDLLQALIDDGEYIGEPTSRNSKILKSILDGTEYTDVAQSEIESLLIELKEKGVGGAGIEKLCYATETGENLDYEHDADFTSITEGSNYGEYLSYDHDTKEFTVLKAFDAIITSWVYSYQTASRTTADGALYINDVLIAEYDCNSTAEGTTDGTSIARSLSVGDRIKSVTPNSGGYPMQRLKIYKMNGITPTEYAEINSFTAWEV